MRGPVVPALLALALVVWSPPPAARADPVPVFPGMEIHQDNHLCTLGYVDPVRRIAYTAGHCRGSGPVTDRDNNYIGELATFADNTPTGTTVNTDQVIADYERITLAADVAVNDILPGGRRLVSEQGAGVAPGDPVCHFGVVTGETCGSVEAVNNGWFTMSHGVQSHRGDSGGPVYMVDGLGSARIVGLFNSVWGDFPAAVTWSAIPQ
ncbi:MAG TPA: hypothetical protein VFR17_14250 [Mycobacterium sp.]|nr:hypothetical protein [Mycobacterium sp.]